MSRLNTTEAIIRSLIDNGNSITFLPSDGRKMAISINAEPPQIIAHDFVQMQELFLGHYIKLGIEAGKRIDGGCNDVWHNYEQPNRSTCPSCCVHVDSIVRSGLTLGGG